MTRAVRSREATTRPWANGLGTTRELATLACPTGRHPFGVRLSLADLAGPVPFSTLPGVARVFTIVGASGGALTVDGVTSDVEALVPVEFPGGAAVAFAPAAPTRACNVMACACLEPSVAVAADTRAAAPTDGSAAPDDARVVAVYRLEAIGDGEGELVLDPEPGTPLPGAAPGGAEVPGEPAEGDVRLVVRVRPTGA